MSYRRGRSTTDVKITLSGSVIPPGTIIPFGGAQVPSGWLLCDGSVVSRSEFANLFAAVGTLHGAGDSVSTFHLPDLRGRFLRGSDNMGTGAASRDIDGATRTAANVGGATGASVGSVQADAMQGHWHAFSGSNFSTADGANPPAHYLSAHSARDSAASSTMNAQQYVRSPSTDSANGTPRISAETRPQNTNVNYIIKV